MRDKLNQFVANLNGQFVEVSSKSAIYQCMDLAYNWVFCLDYPKITIQHGNAYEVYTAPNDTTRQYFDIIPNTPDGIPQDGDLVVWSSSYGPAGHIAIALGGGTVNSFMCFEQNNPLGTNAHLQSRSYYRVLGWLRPKVFPTLTITDQTRIPQIDNMEVQAIRSRLNDQQQNIENLNNKISQIRSIIG